MKKQPRITKKELELKYLVEGYSTRDCAKMFNVGQTTIKRWLEYYEIKTRSSKEGIQTNAYKAKQNDIKKKISNSINQYYEKIGLIIEKICPICNNRFKTSSYRNKLTCSSECAKILISDITRNKFNIKYRIDENGKRYKIYTCKICGKEFESIRRVKFCSEECKKEFYNKKSILQRKRIIVQCAQCKKDIERIPSKITEHNFCNAECMSKYYSESNMWSGENSPTWKGGKRHYAGHWYKQRDLARSRDNYTCQICGVTEKKWHKAMDVHHIINYHEFENKEEANALDNLICLCNKCHSYVHSNSNIKKIFIKHKILSDLISDNEHDSLEIMAEK